MIIKQCFQFLNSLCLCLKKQVVFFVRQGLKINKAIIIFNSIEMMDNPAFRKWRPMCLFPDKNMFQNIAVVCTRMVRLINLHIALKGFNSTTFPACMIFSLPLRQRGRCPYLFHGARTTALSAWRYSFTTIYTIVRYFARIFTTSAKPSMPFSMTISATPTTKRWFPTWVTTIYTGMFPTHNAILTHM